MKHKILIVEDEPAIIDTIQYALETDGFETHSVSTGAEAIALLPVQHIDLIVLDIGLPDMNGLESISHFQRTCQSAHPSCQTTWLYPYRTAPGDGASP